VAAHIVMAGGWQCDRRDCGGLPNHDKLGREDLIAEFEAAYSSV
jgi:hypothetical protein